MTLSKQALTLQLLQLLRLHQVRLALLLFCTQFQPNLPPLSAGDYTIVSPDITFTDGSSIMCVGVSVVDDMTDEGIETARLELSSTNSQAVVTDTSILRFVDNNGMLQLQLITLVSFVALHGS